MTDTITLTLDVRVAWWLRPYLTAAVLLHQLRFPIDFGCVRDVVDRAITFSIGGSRPRHVFSNRPA